MKSRCLNPKSQQYHNYGGRGIKVCEQWLDSFESFLADMGPRPSSMHSIDRIDNDGNYEPGNCRWATMREQSSNRRATRIVTFAGKKMTVHELSELCGVPLPRLKTRLGRGWPVERAIVP
jgi:hypothetical protein